MITLSVQTLLVSGLISLGIAYFGYRKKSLSFDGALSAVLVGFITCSAGLRFAITLLLFFFSSSWLTKLQGHKKQKIEDGYREGGQRTCNK